MRLGASGHCRQQLGSIPKPAVSEPMGGSSLRWCAIRLEFTIKVTVVDLELTMHLSKYAQPSPKKTAENHLIIADHSWS